MSTQKLLAPALFAAFFMFSCGADRSPQSEGESYHLADSSIMADGNNSSYATATEQQKALKEPAANEIRLESEIKADSIAKLLPSSAAALNALDSTHMFIRTADVRCRVDEVENSTYQVEKVVSGLGGYVSNTQLASTQTWSSQTQVSDDSMKQVTKFVVSNTLTIRVPARQLDSLLTALVPLVDYMDYRNVTVNDITLEQLAKQLEQSRLAKYNALLQDKIVDETNKPDKLMTAADAMLSKQEQMDWAYLESLRLKDKVAYATLNLQLYQPETSSTVMIFNERPQPPYEIGIGERLGNSLYAGWKGFSYILSGVVILWPLWLIGGIVFFFVRRQMKKAAKAA